MNLPTDRGAIVGFNASATKAVALTGDREALHAGLSSLQNSPGTLIDTGLTAARELIEADRRDNVRPVVILLTDGLHNREPAEVEAAADALKNIGSLIFTIGLGQNVQADLLQRVATEPTGYYNSPSTDELAAIYDSILVRIDCDEIDG